MSVVFEARIKNRGESPHDWFIELTDTLSNKKEECNNLEEFSKKIEEFGSAYNGQIDEVKWSKDDNVTQDQYSEINAGMRKYQEELNK
ncbi:hypothetical protein [Arcobacter sp. s6]|uniref:hypothetical protein n=1 Tax=Arcobacter sp. s6 TaxID=3230363 RepID=UPI0034A0888A